MKVLLVALIAVLYVSGLVEAGGSSWDEYLDDGEPAVSLDLDEEERKPLILAEPSEEDCDRFRLDMLLKHFDPNERADNPKAVVERKTVSYCKEKLEKRMMNSLAKVDNRVKTQVDSLVENVIKANGGQGFEKDKSYLPEGSVYEGILATIQENGADLSSIRGYSDFMSKFVPLQEACNKLWNGIAEAYSYSVFLKTDKIQAEPTVARWTRNALFCFSLIDEHTPYPSGAFELLEKENQKAQQAGNKGGKRFSMLKAFKRSH